MIKNFEIMFFICAMILDEAKLQFIQSWEIFGG